MRREIARASYNYFNPNEPYFGDPLRDREQIDPSNPFSELGEEQSVDETDGAVEIVEPESQDENNGPDTNNESGEGS